MLKHLVTRSFDGAAFVFDPVTQNSLFVEGTASELVKTFLYDIDALIPETYWLEIPWDCLIQAREEVEKLRTTVRSFLRNLDAGKGQVKQSDAIGGETESPMRKLSDYGVRNWQIINVSIEMTYQCILRCQWCYLNNFSQQGLSRQELQKVADQLKKTGAVFALFTGGETFLRRDIIDVMTDFKDRGFALEAKSNGLLLSGALISQLADLELFNLQISVYGIEDSQVSFMGRPYVFSQLAKNIREMVNQGLPISLAVLVGKHNIDDLDRYNKILLGLGVSEIFYSPYITPNRAGAGAEVNLRLSRREMDEKFYPFLQKVNGFVSPNRYRAHCKDAPACYAGRDQVAIDPQGIVFPCLDLRLPLGNLKQESLDQILERRQQFLEPYKLGRIEKCCKCPIVEFCDSCVGTALLENGCFTTPSQHKCDVSRFYHDSYFKQKEKPSQL